MINSGTINLSNNSCLESQAVFETYKTGEISLNKLAELLAIPLEEAKHELPQRNIPLNLGIESKSELLNDLENA